MKLSFAKNMKRNLAAGFLNRGISVVFPFLNRTLFLWLLGPEYLGLTGLFRSILGILSLAELGFGTAVACAMYKPIAEDDHGLVCAYLKFFRTVYRWIGSCVFLVGLCLMPFLRRLIHGDVPPDLNLHLLFLIHLVNSTASYFFTAYRGPVLNAFHRNDVTLHIQSAIQATQYVTVFLILFFTRNYYAYVGTGVFFTVAGNLAIYLATARLFPDLVPAGELPAENRRRLVSDIKSICLHKVGGVISVSADNLVISSFLGLAAIAVYGNYYYVVTTVASVVAVFYLFTQGGFGNRIHTESRRKNFVLFMRMNRATMMVTACCAAMMASLYQPFIAIWTKHDPAMLRHALTPILMVLHFHVMQSRQTLTMFKTAAGLFRQDRWKPLAGGAVNILFTLAFLLWLPEGYKLDGVIFATTLSWLFVQQPWETRVVFTSFFDRRMGAAYWRAQVRYAFSTGILSVAAWWISRAVTVVGIPGFLFRALVAAAVVASLVPLFFFHGVHDAIGFIRKKA